jgi:predicted ester cyclase
MVAGVNADSPGNSVTGAEAAASSTLARWYEAWNAHDVNAISELMTYNVRYEDPSAPAALMRGRDPVEQYVRSAFSAIPDLHLEKLEEWVTPGGGAIASWFRFSGTFRAPLTAPGLAPLAPTGKPIDLFGMDRSEIREGRLARHQIFWDMVELGRQVGAFPARGSVAENLTRRLQHLAARRMRGRS